MLRAALGKIKATLNPGGPSHTAPLPGAVRIDDFNVVSEGRAQILFPKTETVFYNPIQQFNRDLSVTCIKAWDNLYGADRFNKKHKNKNRTNKRRKLDDGTANSHATNTQDQRYIKILEALSATGLRAIRYAHEIPHVSEVIANDLLPAAVQSIERNVQYNNVQHLVKPNLDDANVLMYRNKATNNKYHVIDLDPYGTVTPFVDAALQNIEDEGLMLVTCTDLSVLAGNGYPEKCFALYGGVNMVSHEATHESALRLVLHLLNQSAAKYKKSVQPLLSLSIDFYVRVFVKVKTSPIEVKNLQSNTMITYHCSQCGSTHNQRMGRTTERDGKKKLKKITKYSVAQGPPVDHKCRFCGGTYLLAGPMYAGPLHDQEFVDEVLRINKIDHDSMDDVYGTRKRIEGMVTVAKNELANAPFYFSPNMVSSILKLQVPPLKRVAAGLGSLGFECSMTHAQPSSLKTTAPWEAIWYVMRQCDPNKKLEKMNERSPGYKILHSMDQWMPQQQDDSNSNTDEMLFDKTKLSFEENEQSGRIEKLRKLKIVKYQENPTKNWGPKARPNSS